MSLAMYSGIFYVVLTNSLVLLWLLLVNISIRKHPISSLIDLVIFVTLSAVTPFMIMALMVLYEYGFAVLETAINWPVISAGYIVSTCCGWLFIIYKKVDESKSKTRLVMPK